MASGGHLGDAGSRCTAEQLLGCPTPPVTYHQLLSHGRTAVGVVTNPEGRPLTQEKRTDLSLGANPESLTLAPATGKISLCSSPKKSFLHHRARHPSDASGLCSHCPWLVPSVPTSFSSERRKGDIPGRQEL